MSSVADGRGGWRWVWWAMGYGGGMWEASLGGPVARQVLYLHGQSWMDAMAVDLPLPYLTRPPRGILRLLPQPAGGVRCAS